MRIFFIKKQEKKSKAINRILMAICLLCSTIISFVILNQPSAKWQETDEWQIKVYQKADHMMSSSDPTWIMINELKMSLIRQESDLTPWCLQVADLGGNELLPGISRLEIYYSEDLEVIDGKALNEAGQKVMNMDEFFYLSLYGGEFFSPQRKRYQNLLMFVKDEVKVELSDDKGKNAWWDKDHPWWTSYESSDPPLKAQLQIN